MSKELRLQTRTKECEFCGRPYIQPCDSDKRAAKCGNVKLSRKAQKREKRR